MVIWIEAKNPSLYSSGISSWLHSLLNSLNLEQSDYQLAGPRKLVQGIYKDLVVSRIGLPWFTFLPRKFNHLLYDNLLFRYFSSKSEISTVFAPYYDVGVSKKKRLISTIHDLCYLEVPEVYSFLQRHYYGYCLKRAAKNSIAIVTVSNTSKNAIVSHFHYPENRILVIPNQVDQNFLEYYPNESDVKETEKYFGQSDCKILYTGGFENRKNVERLLLGIQNLRDQFPNLKLCITGDQEQAWSKILHKFPDLNDSVKMTGKVTSKQLKTLYLIADVVVYPSLSEGYGRACIEAMATGTPLACSDISIFHEVAGDYAIYFDPLDINSISNGITTAKNSSRKAPIVNPEDISSSDLHKLKELLLEGGSLEPKR